MVRLYLFTSGMAVSPPCLVATYFFSPIFPTKIFISKKKKNPPAPPPPQYSNGGHLWSLGSLLLVIGYFDINTIYPHSGCSIQSEYCLQDMVYATTGHEIEHVTGTEDAYNNYFRQRLIYCAGPVQQPIQLFMVYCQG